MSYGLRQGELSLLIIFAKYSFLLSPSCNFSRQIVGGEAKFKVKTTTKMRRVLNAYARVTDLEDLGIHASFLRLVIAGGCIHPDATPEQLKLHDHDRIECVLDGQEQSTETKTFQRDHDKIYCVTMESRQPETPRNFLDTNDSVAFCVKQRPYTEPPPSCVLELWNEVAANITNGSRECSLRHLLFNNMFLAYLSLNIIPIHRFRSRMCQSRGLPGMRSILP